MNDFYSWQNASLLVFTVAVLVCFLCAGLEVYYAQKKK